MTLSQELRQSVISRVEQGIQYRDISRELNISVGSVVNIIKNHKTGNGHEQPIEVKTLQAQNHVVYEPNQELQDIDFADNPYPESDVYTDPNADYDERYDGLEGERRFNYQNPMFPKQRLDISDTGHHNYVTKKTKETEENSEEPYQSRSSAPDFEDSSLGLGIDWDSNYQARFVRWVMYEKKRRQESERKLQEQWGILIQERNNLEAAKRDLEAREAKLAEIKDLIPSAKELKSMGVEFTHAIAWINVIREYASKKMVDERTAAWRLAEDLKNWQELGGFENAIQNAKNQLSLLNMTLEQQKGAVAIIADLKRSGMTNEDISNLVKVVSRWSNVGQGSSFELDSRLNLPKTNKNTLVS